MGTDTPSPLIGRTFLKMNGAGNEIVVLDLRGEKHVVTAAEAAALCRGDGSFFDQLMVISDPQTPGTEAYIRIYNGDGSSSAACGNGTRCVAWYLMRDTDKTAITLQSPAGLLNCRKIDATTFSVDMGKPRLAWEQIPLAEPFADTRAIELQIGPIDAPILHSPGVVNMGNPHAVFWVDDPYRFNLEQIGPLLENHPIFPERANIELAAVKAPDHIILRVWERGAGITQACGSGACAALVAAARTRRSSRKARVSLPGGDLFIEWRDDDHVIMTGPVEFEHEGRIDAGLFAVTA